MCQIDSQYMLSSNFSCFCVLVAVMRVFTASTSEEAPVPLNCDRFARSSCFLWLRERFLQTRSSSRIQLSWRHRWNRKYNRTSGRMATRLCRRAESNIFCQSTVKSTNKCWVSVTSVKEVVVYLIWFPNDWCLLGDCLPIRNVSHYFVVVANNNSCRWQFVCQKAKQSTCYSK